MIPSSKRQRLNEPQSHPPSESSNQIDQSNNQTIRQPCCYISELPAPLFVLVCEYLELDEKCFRLPVLSKAMKSMFNPTTCCRGPLTVDLRQNNSSIVDRCLARFAYTPYASSVRCMFWAVAIDRLFPTGTNALILRTMEAVMDNPALHSLELTEDNFAIVHLMLSKLSSVNNRPISINQSITLSHVHATTLSRLRVLKLYFWLLDTPESEYEVLKLCDWSALRYCTSLETFSFESDFGPAEVLEPILDNLPHGLTELVMGSFERIHSCLNARLRSPAYLPCLEWLRVSGEHEEFLCGLSTVIPATGLPRPVTSLSTRIDTAGLNFDWCHQIHTLDVRCDLQFIGTFCNISDDALPLLCHFDFKADFYGAACDILPVFVFASKRPIRTLKIVTVHAVAVNVYAAIKCLVNMTVLTSLHLDVLRRFPQSQPGSHGNELASLIPAGCWSQLTSLTLSDIDWSPQDAMCFIQASPNLTELCVHQTSSFSWIPFVPVVAHCCPRIVSFLILQRQTGASNVVLDVCALPQLQAAYASWPLASTGFQHLQRLKIDGFDLGCLGLRWGLFEHTFEYNDLLVAETRDSSRWRFCTLADSLPVDGRKLFLDQLYRRLEEEEQQLDTTGLSPPHC